MPTTPAAFEFVGLTDDPVLIVAAHPVLAAALGLAVELEGACPCFPAPHERLEEALLRLRPTLLLLDVEHGAAGEDETYRCAADSGSQLVLVGPARRPHRLLRLAERRGMQALALPAELSELRALLPSAAGQSAHAPLVRRNGHWSRASLSAGRAGGRTSP